MAEENKKEIRINDVKYKLQRMIEKSLLPKYRIDGCKVNSRNRPIKGAGVKRIRAQQHLKVDLMNLWICYNEREIVPNKTIKEDREIDNETNDKENE